MFTYNVELIDEEKIWNLLFLDHNTKNMLKLWQDIHIWGNAPIHVYIDNMLVKES